jgi:hypothetical protein
MSESNENAQQRAYYSSHRSDSRYWWSLFIFLLNAIVLNAFKLWDRLNLDFKLTHSKFQYQIVEMLLVDGATRKKSITMSIMSFDADDKSISCEWEHIDKRSYCKLCSEKRIRLRKRPAFEEISANLIKKRRSAQTNWRCKSCEPCCKKEDCWRALHSDSIS